LKESLRTVVKVVRLEQTEQGALGAMILFNELFCSTLEPDNKDPKRNQIPEGVYQCKRFQGAKFKDTFEIIVPNHTAVLFHAGNVEGNTTMCVLLGQYPGKLKEERSVLNSGLTFKLFMNRLFNKQSFEAEFIDFYSEEGEN